MKRTWNENAALRGAWRRIFARSPIVLEVLNEGRRTVPRYKKDGDRHKVDRVEFQCQVCGNWEIRDRVEVDHIIPVIDPKVGFVDWNTFHARLFCDKKNLQRICDPCHDKKTQEERILRNTIKYNAELELLEHEWTEFHPQNELKKLLKKYTTKTKPDVIRQRAAKLLEHLLNPKKAKKRKKR